MTTRGVIARLRRLGRPANAAGMGRFGIRPASRVLGISIWDLRRLAKEIGHDHRLAQGLWASGIHEAKILASFVEEPARVTDRQLDRWARAFDSWDLVDQVSALIAQTPYVVPKIHQWSTREEEFIRRAAFALIAEIAWYDRTMADGQFEQFFPLIRRAATDERNFVKKAVNWALRNIGKRSPALRARAIAVGRDLQRIEAPSARWIASDALRELTSPAVRTRVAQRAAAGRVRQSPGPRRGERSR